MIAKRILPAQIMGATSICALRRTRPGITAVAALAVCFCVAALPARSQDSKLADGPPPPPSEEPSSQPKPVAPAPAPAPAPSGESSSRSAPSGDPSSRSAPVDPASSGPAAPEEPAEAAPPPQPVLDPVGAKRSLDVGTFYMKKGDYDAAIDRFKEAADRQPKQAKPYLLLGEAYEKKNDPASAVSAYRKYLQLYSGAPDEDKVNKRIEKLTALESKRDPLQH